MGAGYKFIAKANKEADILIYEDVGAGWFGGVTADQIAADIKSAGQVDTLNVRIASYGGDVNEGLAIYRMLARSDAKVVTHVDGIAASISSVIAMAGAERVISESGQIMIHDAWTICAGQASEMRKMADELEATSDDLAGIYATRSGRTTEEMRALMRETTWLHGQAAIDAKLADRLAPNVGFAAHAHSIWASTMHSRIAMRLHAEKAPVVRSEADRRLVDGINAAAARMQRTHALSSFKTRGAG